MVPVTLNNQIINLMNFSVFNSVICGLSDALNALNLSGEKICFIECRELNCNQFMGKLAWGNTGCFLFFLARDNKMKVSGIYPRNAEGEICTVWNEQNKTVLAPEIGMSFDKGAEKAAKQIASRFWDDFAKYCAMYLMQRLADNKRVSDRNAFIREICEVNNCAPRKGTRSQSELLREDYPVLNKTTSSRLGSGEIIIGRDEVEFVRFRLSRFAAKRVLAFLSELEDEVIKIDEAAKDHRRINARNNPEDKA